MYREYAPHPLLAPYIETYWVSEGFYSEYKTERILPDGCVDIIFDLDENAEGEYLPEIIGTMTSFSDIGYTGNMRMFGLRFNPAAITSFTRVPIDAITNKSVGIDSLFDAEFYNCIDPSVTIPAIISRIEEYLLCKLSCIYPADKRIHFAISLIK